MRQTRVLFSMISLGCYGQNTVSFPENATSLKADLTETSWMEGHWKGEAFGGIIEETWSPPLGDSMLFTLNW
ncbi:MAG: DUF6265 family protein [Saonia sp.]